MKLNMEEYAMISKETKVRGKFINRELSWIQFNKRVLSCAFRKDNPMNERLNFLGITDSNLDEFISVRFSNAYHHKNEEPYKDILHKIIKFKDTQNNVYMMLRKEIEKDFHLSFVTNPTGSEKQSVPSQTPLLQNAVPFQAESISAVSKKNM